VNEGLLCNLLFTFLLLYKIPPNAIALIVYRIMVITGDLISLAKSKRTITLFSIILSVAELMISGIVTAQGQGWGKIVGIAITTLLVIIFVMRFLKTKKFMSTALMIIGGAATLFVAIHTS
jgi:uncharacterized membrane protein (UPF0136 family)